MKFYIGEENGSGCEYKTKEELLACLSEKIDEHEAQGKSWFTVTIENEG